jgi:hypothetical protein
MGFIDWLKRTFPPDPVPGEPAPVPAQQKVQVEVAVKKDDEPVAAEVKTGRVYNFDLPYTIGRFQVGFAIQMLVRNELWYSLTPEMADKLNRAYSRSEEVVITKEDLDALPDNIWRFIEKNLG